MDFLSQQAKANPRLRQAFDLRTTPEDQSQRILNAVEPGTVLPIHRHRGSTETIIVLRGKVVQHYYNKIGFVSPVRRYEALDRCTAAANVI